MIDKNELAMILQDATIDEIEELLKQVEPNTYEAMMIEEELEERASY